MAKIIVLLLCLVVVAFGFVNGSVDEKEKIGIFELKKGEISLKVTNWGASIVSLVLPDKNGMNKCLYSNLFLLSICCFINAMSFNLCVFLYVICV
jgi:hypothetical protein